MKLIDTYTGKEIAAIITNHGLTMDEAIELSGMEEIVIDPGTEEIGYRDADGDEFLPICVAVHYVLNIDGHNNYLDNVEYVLYDGDNWYIPLKENAVKKTSKEEAVLWVQQYMKAVESYEDRVNAAPPVSLEVSMFGGDKAAYPTKDELDAMPKNE